MSKNNAKMVQQKMSDQRQKFGIRKLSVGVASVLLGTVFYMQGGVVHADVNPTVSSGDNSVNVVNENSGTSSLAVGSGTSSSAGSANSASPVVSASDVTNSIATSQTSSSSVVSAAGQVSNAVSAVSDQGSVTPASQVNVGVDKIVKDENANVDSDPTQVRNSQVASEKSVAGSGIVNSSGVTPSQPGLATPAETEVQVANLAVDSKVNIAYTVNDQAIKINYVDSDNNDPVDLTKWTYNVDNLGNAHVLSYNGDITQPIYIPNSYDFIQAGKITAEHKVFITSDNMQKLAGSGIHELYISKNGNGKVIAEDSDWHGTFCGIGSRSGRNAQLSETIGKNLEKLDLTNLDVTNIQNMKNMFSFNSQLTSIGDLSNWDTHNVTNMNNMFFNTSKLTNIGDLSNWDTHNVIDMNSMFSDTSKLTNIGDLSNWDTSKVTDMSYMFSGASKLTNIGNLSNWDTGKVTYMSSMFQAASSLTNIGNLSSWNTSNVTNMSSMFQGASSLTNIGDLSNWDTSKVTYTSYMFYGASKLTNIGNLSNWDTSKVTDMSSMFQAASSLTNIGDLSNWDTSKVTYMSYMFYGASKLTNIGDLSNWDTRNVTSMISMFQAASSLTNIGDLSNWDTHNVTDMSNMFNGASSLTNIGNLSNWDTHNVTNMSTMFNRASSLTNIGNLSNWDTHNVTNMSSMFQGASSLTNIGDLSNWDTSKVTYMSYMFYGASKLTNIGDLSNWDTRNVTSMISMFQAASSLTNIGDLSNWDTSKVTDMSYMFSGASKLTNIGDLSNWNVNKVFNSEEMMFAFGKDSKEPILQKLPSFTKTKNSSSKLPIASTGTGVYDARGVTSSVQRTSANNYHNNHIVLTSDTSLLDHSNISNNVNSEINQITINGNKIALPVFYNDYQDLHDTVQKTIDDYAEKLRSQGKIVKNTPKVADYSTEPTTDWLKYFTNYTIDVVNQTKINYVDTDGTIIHTTVIEGKSGETVSVPNEIPTGYKLVAGLRVPTEITFTADGYPITNLAIEAIHTTVTADNPKTTADKLPDNPTKNYPSGVAESDLNKTVTRTIKMTDPTGKVTTEIQTVHLTRSATVDEVTGDVIYSDWSTDSFDSYDVPVIEGYTASQSKVDKVTVNGNTQDSEVNISYTSDYQTTQIVFVDDDNNGKTVGSKDIKGKTGETQKLTETDLPKNYELANGQSDTITLSADTPKQITVHVKHKVVTKQLKIDTKLYLERLIKYGYTPRNGANYFEWMSNGEVQDIYHTKRNFVDFGSVTGSVQYDLVSGEIVKVNNDETLKFNKVLLNYPSDNDIINGGTLISDPDLVGHTFADVLNESVHDNLSYKAYASANLTKDVLAKDNVFGGEFDDDHNFVQYAFKNGKQYGSDYEIDTSTIDNSFSIKLNDLLNVPRHYRKIINKNDDGSLSTTIHLIMPIVYQAYISKTVTRTINITNPDKTVKTIKQTANINQNVCAYYHHGPYLHKDDAYVTDNNWTTYEVPTVAGYTATQSQVDAVAVDGNTTDQTVDISYTANKQSVNVNYVDVNDGNKVVHTIIVNGVTDGDATIPNELPAGYKLVDGQSVPKTIHFNANNNDNVNVKVQHATVTVTPDSPKTPSDKLPDNPGKSYPSGVAKDDLNKTVTRKVVITTPDGKETVTNQTVTFTRNATVDEVTGNVTYGSWSEDGKHEFATVNVPTVPGYTANGDVPSLTVTPDSKDTTVEITYTANDHQISVKYVDDDQSEKVVDTGTVNGKTGTEVTITPSLPKGYMLTPGKDTPSTYIVTVGDNQVVTIHVQKQFVDTSATDPQAKQTRAVTLHYVYGAGDKQGQKAFDDAVLNVYYHRTATLDRATNKTTYGDWLWDQSQGDPSTPGYHVVSGKWTNIPQHWANVIADVPSIKGYHTDLGQNDPANTNHVPANIWVYPTWNGSGSTGETLDGHESKAYQTSAHLYEVQPEHTVKYMPNKTTLTVKYIDDDNKGAVVGSQHWDGTTGQHINLTLTPPDNYVLSPGWVNPTNYDFDGVNNAWYNVHVKHAVQTQTVTSQMTIHYVNSEDHQQELKAPTVITRRYTRTNISHNDGTTQYGDWSYVPGSFKQTGTPITVNDSDNPVKEDDVFNADKMENMDGFTVIARYPTIEDYTMHDGIGGVRLTDWLGNSDRQAASMVDNFYAEYDEHKERSIAVKFVDDQSDGQQVGQATTVTGRDGDTVDLKLTVPDKYQLARYYQLPTTYTFKKGSGDLEVHLVHQVVQREATADVQMGLLTAVRIGDGDLPFEFPLTITQNQWNQLDDKIKDHGHTYDRIFPLVKVGTLTGHVNYDLVDNKVVSFGDDWTTLNLGGHTYQMPDGTEVVNGIFVDYAPGAWGKSLKEEFLKYYPDTDPDYANRPWHGYLSVNATNNGLSTFIRDSLQAGLVGNEPNMLAKANGDQAATAVKSANKTVDLSLLQGFGLETRDFSEQNGRLQGIAELGVAGVYIPYVEKTATRTINVTTPDGKTTAIKQTATLAKQVDFSKNAHPAWTTSEWTSYDVPAIPGYTASQSQVAKETVTGETKDQTVEITYTANDQSTHVNYVDTQGKTIHTTTVNGKTGQTVKVSNEVPVGWKLVDGQSVPSEITFSPDGHADTSVKIEHQHVTVTPDHPQTNGTKLPNNPAKTFNGVEASDLNKTITRTIKVTTPDGKINTIKQDVKLTRTATVDEVTGDVSYGNWSTGQWVAYQVPAVTGYTATQTEVAATSVNESTKDQTVEVSYTANKQSTVVKYVDDNGQVVHTTTVDGVTDQTVKVPSEVPAGWMITKGQVPSEITFGADGHTPIEVTVAHRHVTVDPDHPQTNGTKLPDNLAKTFTGVEANDLNKTITRTIKVTTPDGQTKTVTQTVKLTRNADVDEVTGEVTYGKWTTGQWDAYEVPAVPGYTASQTSVAATPVDGNATDQTINISYTANSQTTHINYVDESGNTVHTTTVIGKTDETAKVPNEVPAGWMITKGQVPSEITFGADGHEPIEVTVGHRHVTVDPDHPQTNGTKLPNNPAKTFNGVEANDLNKTITRTIKVTQPDGTVTNKVQTVKLTRNATVDEVTGEVTYGKWTTSEWDAYAIPSVKGYTASQASVAATPVDENTKAQTVEVSYTANKQSTVVKYVDGKGQVVHTTTVDGVTDQTVKVPSEVPVGWMITKGEVPSEITFGPDGYKPVAITVGHHHVTVDPTDPKNPTDTLPDNPARNYPAGVGESDLNKTITRTIKVTTPDGQTKTVAQTAKLTRTADVDEVTGEVTYSKWTTGQWDAYEIPSVKGYTASQASVAATPVTSDTKDQTVEVSYTANKQSTVVKYVDDKSQVVHTTTVNGVTDQTVKVPSEVPAGWMITKGQVPSEITFGANGHEPIEVTVGHRHVTVDPDHPQTNGTKLPNNPAKTFNGVEANDLNKTIARTIKVTTPDGQTKTVTQTVKLTRNADVDEVTGEVTYGKWTTGQWDAYEVPIVPGYTASQTSVAATPVDGITKDQTITISYTANSQTTHINYVDESGKTVHTTTVTGKTGETVKVPSEVPAGWMITKGEVPSEITFGPDGYKPVAITVGHHHVTVDPTDPKNPTDTLPDNPAKTFNGVEANDLNKTITRTIKVTTPDGQIKTVAQTVKLTRTATVDEVTGDVTYSNWSTGQWAKYDVPAVIGYTATQTEVAVTTVDEHTADQTVDVSYTPNKQTTTVKYVDDKGEVVHATTVDGVTNQTVKVPSGVPVGWTIVKGQVPSELTFGANGHELIEVTVSHHHVTVTPDHPQTNGTKLPDNPAKTFNGVEENDLNKTITRMIKVTTPDGKTATTTQTAKLTRTASVDEVTGEVAYGDWTTGEWAAYDVPSVAGYTPSQVKVDKEIVTAASKDTTTTITYTPNQHQISVEYVDDDAYGKVVKTDQVPGKTDQTITITPSAPTNYDLVDNGNRTYTVTSGDGQRVEIHVTHHQVTTSESKTVARTINVRTPHDGVKTVKQTVELNRDVTTDQVTGEKTYGDWTTGQWKAYTPDVIPGYTSSTNEVPTADVGGSSTEQTIDVTYTANTQHVDIVYVDDAKGGAVVKTDQVVGKTDETVKVTPNVPTGYKVVGEVPGSYTMTADGRQAITVHLVHQTKTVSESKAVIRTINVHTPHDGTTVFKQTVDLSRDVTTDQVTGDKTYGDWSTTEWTHYDVPAVAGYTPSIKQVAQQVVDGTTTDQTVNVTYTANSQTTHINYVDGDGNTVHTTTVTGKTDQTVKVPNETPAGWKVVGESVPTEITFGPDGHADVVVTVDHQYVTVTPDDPKTPADKLPNNSGKTYPDGVGHSDLNRTVIRTIKVVTPDGQTKTVTQKVQLTRTADIDEVTGKVTYGKWTTGEWSRYEAPSVPGYTASQSEVPAVNVTDTTKDQMLTLTYTANDQTTHVNYVDGNGKTVHMTTITGKTDQTVKVPNEVPTGWTITDGQVPAEITFGPDGHDDVTVTVGHQHVTVTPDQPNTPSDKLPNNPGKTYPSGVGHDYLNKMITRTVKVTTPDGKTQTTEQKVQLTRIADVDEVTGEVTYGKWTTGEWANYNVSAVPGYTASQSNVPATKVTSDTKNQTVTVTYMANTQITTINYVDQTGKTVHTTVVNGHTDQTVNVPNETPAGWIITKGQVPTEITFGSNGHDYVTVTVDHKDVSVTPDKPQTDGTKLPDNPSQTFYGVGRDDLNKTITRTIEVTAPTGKTDTIKQTAKLTRTASVDEVTGAVTYGDWTTSEWPAFIVPSVPGYTPSQKTISSITVKSGDKDVEETVIYSPDKQVMTINYIDDVTGKTLSTKQIIGVSDASANYNTKSSINNYVADHYKLVSDDTNSDNLVFDHDDSTDQVYNVHLTHTYQTVDDHKAVNETVHYVYDNGQMARPDYKAPAISFSRTGTKDLVTSNIVWNDWTPAEQSFDQVTTPAINGYTPDFEFVPSVNVNYGSADVERTVIYHADDQTILVNYIDDDTHSTLKTDTVIGKTAQNSNYTTKKLIDGYVADHYELVSDDTNNNELVFDSDSTKAQVYNVHLKHVHQNVSDLTSVNETIHYIYADGSKARDDYHAPAISFERTGDKDLVTNAIVWDAWLPASQDFKAVDSPVIDGYTPSQKTINSITVKPGDKDIDQTVIYVPDTQSIVVNYIDDVTGKTLKTDTLTGKSDLASDYTTKNDINGYENQHYVLVSDDTQGKTLTFDHDDKATQVYNVHLSHQTESASQSRTVHETIDYVYADGSKAVDTVTATPLTFTQTGVKDLVTGNIDWNGTWTSKQAFAEVKSLEITGYTASRKVVDPITVDHNSSDIHQTVIYVANNQTAKVKYIDDTTGKTLETDSANGKFGDQINFGHDVDTQIKAFEVQGYKFKSNSFNGQRYQADNSKNQFEVHFIHGKQNVSRTDKVTETVKYQFADGRQAQKDHVQTAEFTQHGIQDLVTKTTDWTPSDPQTFVIVNTPHITGYTADVQNVPAVTVDFGDGEIIKVVTYKANDQLAGIKYIDDTTGKTLDTEAASGKFGTKIEFMSDPSSVIQKFEGQGYKLVSNSFKDQDYQADDSQNQFEVHFKHAMKNVSRTSTITRNIKYVDQKTGKEVHQPVIQTLTFTENGVTDLVTGKTTWETPSDQQFVKVESPKIDGYENPDILVVDAKTAKFGDSDQTVTVHYQKVETPSTSDTPKELNNLSTPSVPITQNESNSSIMPQASSQNASGQQISNNSDEDQLPQTGNQNSHQADLIGLMSLTLAGLLGFGKRRKKND